MATTDDNTRAHGRDLTQGNIASLLITFTLPFLIGNIIQAAYGIVNRMWVGHYLGTEATAAISNALQVSFILISVANGLVMGASILVSQYAGAQNWTDVKRVAQSSLVLLFGLSVVVVVVGELLTTPLLRAIGTPPSAFAMAEGYMRIFLLTFPLIFLSVLTTFLLRGVGDSVTPLIFQAIGVVITAVLDPLFMLGWLGFPRLGLNGAAVATLIAQTVTIVAFFTYLARKRHILAPNWLDWKVDWAIGASIMKISLPSAAQQLLISFGTSVIQLFINQYGVAASAAFGAASQIDAVAFFIAMSFSMAIAMLAGQNIGARRLDRVKSIFLWGIIWSGGLCTIPAVLAMVQPEMLMRVFLDPVVNAEAFAIGVDYLRILGPAYLFIAVMFVGMGIINGSGHTLLATLLTLLSLWCLRIPLAWYLSHRLDRVEGIWYTITFTFGISMLISLGYYFSGVWKQPVIRHRPSPADAVKAEASCAAATPGPVAIDNPIE